MFICKFSISPVLFCCFNIFGSFNLVPVLTEGREMDFSKTFDFSHSENIVNSNGAGEDTGIFALESDGSPVTNWKNFEGNYPTFLEAFASIEGHQYNLQLTQNVDLLSERYKEHGKDGTVSKFKDIKDLNNYCYYRGSVVGSSNSYAAINVCKGQISGTFHVDHNRFFVESTNGTNAKVFKNFAQDERQHNFSCGFVNSNNSTFSHLPSKFSRKKRAIDFPNYYSRYVKWDQLYVEFAIVFDDSMYRKYNRDLELLYDRAKRLVNLMNAFYQPVNIKIALVAVEIWQEGDPFTVNNSGDATLEAFHGYRSSRMTGSRANDNAQLVTDIPFNGGVVGKALKGTICSSDMSDAVVNDHSSKEIYVAATMAHEMGHNFGMEHDNETCVCPQDRCLMAASSGSMAPLYWSDCSLEYLKWALTHGSDVCLKNKPSRFFGGPICGNGFTEDGEECDCGLPSACDNKCCNATTCKFNTGALCATGHCCDVSSCTVKPLATECRTASNDCDLPEFCNGKSEFCPSDTHKHDGVACNSNKAFCSDGHCSTHDDQCVLLWGPTGRSADNMCYNLNIKGDPPGNCGMESTTYLPCAQSDVQCGRLQCKHENEKTVFGSKSVVRFTNTILRSSSGDVTVCQSARIDLGSDIRDPGLVPNGAKCGSSSKKMCYDTKCVDVNSVLEKTNCQNNCHGVGVCNNLGHCHCDPGYGGVDCGIPGLGGSIDSGPASIGGQFNIVLAVLIFVFVVIPIIVVVITLLYRKKLLKSPRMKFFSALFPTAVPKSAKRPPPAGGINNSATSVNIISNGTSAVKSSTGQQKSKFSPMVPQLPVTVSKPMTSSPASNRNDAYYSKPPVLTEVTWHQNGQQPAVAKLDTTWSSSNNPPSTAANSQSATLTRRPSTTRPLVPAPPRPKRPDGETMEKLYIEAPELAPSKPGESLLTDVLSALKIDEDKIVPQRRAPPPPAAANYSEPVKHADAANETSGPAVAVADRKKLFQGAADPPAASQSLGRTTGKSIAGAVISKPLNPLIGGTPANQAPSLTVVSRLDENHATLPRPVAAKIPKPAPADSAKPQPPTKNGTAANRTALRRSSSGSSGSGGGGLRPGHAPPLPPKPSNLPLNGTSNGESENYYDIIPSPSAGGVKRPQLQQRPVADEEDLYDDIDEYRKTDNGYQHDDKKILQNGVGGLVNKNGNKTVPPALPQKTAASAKPQQPQVAMTTAAASKVGRLAAGFETANWEGSKSLKN